MNIVADIGGTKIRIAAVNSADRFEEPVILDTPKDFEEGIELFVETVKKNAGGEKIEKIVVGLPGILDKEKDRLFKAPHLTAWEKKPVKQVLEEKLKAKVYLENDTALVGLGEATVGAGKGLPIVVYITISTGVGGARIVDQKIDERKYGFEPGHHIIMIDGKPNEFENFVSGTAIEKKYGKKPFEITDEEVWDDLAKDVSLMVYNLMLDWSPDIIVFGGSMFKEVGIKVEAIDKYLRHHAQIFPEFPIMKKAELGDVGGLWGGLSYLKSLN